MARQKKNVVTLSEARIEKMEAGDRRRYVHDSESPLYVIVEASGTKTYGCRVTCNGTSSRVTIGKAGPRGVRLDEARKIARFKTGQAAAGIDIVEQGRQAKAEGTLTDLFVEWADAAGRDQKRWADTESRWQRLIQPALGTRKLSQISRDDCAKLHRKITRDRGAVVANRTIELLRGLFNFSEAYKGDRNPAKGFKLNTEKARRRILADHELPRFIAALAEENSIIRGVVTALLFTGARKKTVFSMEWTEIDLEHGTWTIPPAKQKTGDEQVVRLCSPVISMLHERLGERYGNERYVFPAIRSDSKAGHVNGLQRAWPRILKRAGIDSLTVHDLRRTLASWMKRDGADLATVGHQLGHTKLQTTAAVYAALGIEQEAAGALETTAQRMLAAAGAAAAPESVTALKARIAALEEENASLRAQVHELRIA